MKNEENVKKSEIAKSAKTRKREKKPKTTQNAKQ